MREQITLTGDGAEPSIRELSLDETELVGGGFSWGGLVHGAEHAASNVAHDAVTLAEAGAASKVVTGAGKLATKAWKAYGRFRSGPDEPLEGPEFWLPE